MIVINGNNIEILKQYPDNYFDSIVTDPPYGLGKEPNAEKLMKDWIEKGYHEISGTGFMGKEWDAFIPQPIFWKEVFRVLKHGGHVLSFFGTRTYDWGVMSMRFAGFEVRDCIQWIYGSGFPKSHNIGKAIDAIEKTGKSNPKALREARMGDEYEPTGQKDYTKGRMFSSEIKNDNRQQNITNAYEGWGTALKPANEPIVLARKPLSEKSIAENVLKWGTGGINIDGCRVGTTDTYNYKNGPQGNSFSVGEKPDGKRNEPVEMNSEGRFPANLILECICDEVIEGEKGEVIEHNGSGGIWNEGTKEPVGRTYNDKGDIHTNPNCPCYLLDEQSGVSKSAKGINSGRKNGVHEYGFKGESDFEFGYSDKGGASRFFYQAKASKAERNKGLEGFEQKIIEGRDEGQDDRNVAYKPRPTPMANIHPTVKPVKLMQYLVRLITPPNGIVLDPFCGSGTTGVACKLEGFEFVGIDQDAEYCKIANARISNIEEKQLKLF